MSQFTMRNHNYYDNAETARNRLFDTHKGEQNEDHHLNLKGDGEGKAGSSVKAKSSPKNSVDSKSKTDSKNKTDAKSKTDSKSTADSKSNTDSKSSLSNRLSKSKSTQSSIERTSDKGDSTIDTVGKGSSKSKGTQKKSEASSDKYGFEDNEEKWHDAKKQPPESESSVAVLNCIYDNVSMAQKCIEIVLPKVKNTKLAEYLDSQCDQYRDYMNRAIDIAEKIGSDLVTTDCAGKIMARVSLKTKLLFDSSTTHIAEMMILGTTMGIIDMGRLLRKSPNLPPETQILADDVMDYEESKTTSLKYYL